MYKQELDSLPADATQATINGLRNSYAAMLYRAGDCKQALDIQTDVARESPNNLGYQASYAIALVNCGGSRQEAQRIADALGAVSGPFLLGDHLRQRARVLAALGDQEGAVLALKDAFDQGTPWIGDSLHIDPAFQMLRDYPRFQELLKPKG
jgi:hypothetical protein